MSITLVREFHDRFGVPEATEPTVDDGNVSLHRIRLLAEELNELCVALGLSVRVATTEIDPSEAEAPDPVATLDALTDLDYVLAGSWLQLGFAPMRDDALLEVHRTNLAKLGPDGLPTYDERGKIQKPTDWRGPNLSAVIRKHRRGGL